MSKGRVLTKKKWGHCAKNMEKIQTDFGSEEALIANLVKPTLYKNV